MLTENQQKKEEVEIKKRNLNGCKEREFFHSQAT